MYKGTLALIQYSRILFSDAFLGFRVISNYKKSKTLSPKLSNVCELHIDFSIDSKSPGVVKSIPWKKWKFGRGEVGCFGTPNLQIKS